MLCENCVCVDTAALSAPAAGAARGADGKRRRQAEPVFVTDSDPEGRFMRIGGADGGCACVEHLPMEEIV